MITEEQIQARTTIIEKEIKEYADLTIRGGIGVLAGALAYRFAALELKVEELEARPTHVEHMVVSGGVGISL